MHENNYYITRQSPPPKKSLLGDYENILLLGGLAVGLGFLYVYSINQVKTGMVEGLGKGLSEGMTQIERDLRQGAKDDITGLRSDLSSLLSGFSKWTTPNINVTLPDLSKVADQVGTGQNISDLDAWLRQKISGLLPSATTPTYSGPSHPATPGLDSVAVDTSLPSIADAITIGGLFTTKEDAAKALAQKKNEVAVKSEVPKPVYGATQTMTTTSEGGQGIYSNDQGKVISVLSGQEKILDDWWNYPGGKDNPNYKAAHPEQQQQQQAKSPDTPTPKSEVPVTSPVLKAQGWYVKDGVWRQHGVDGY